MPLSVQAYVYDVSGGAVSYLSYFMPGSKVDIIPHTGIVINGEREYFFGGGIRLGAPKKCIEMEPVEVIELGFTSKKESEFISWLLSVQDTWSTENYDFLDHNCNHFANEMTEWLGVDGLPERITKAADLALGKKEDAFFMRTCIEYLDSWCRTDPFHNTPEVSQKDTKNYSRESSVTSPQNYSRESSVTSPQNYSRAGSVTSPQNYSRAGSVTSPQNFTRADSFTTAQNYSRADSFTTAQNYSRESVVTTYDNWSRADTTAPNWSRAEFVKTPQNFDKAGSHGTPFSRRDSAVDMTDMCP